MSLTLRQLLESMENRNQDTESMEAIRTGLNQRDDFWDDFIMVLNNAEALSELFDVPVHKVMGWRQRIQQVLNQVQSADKNNQKTSKTKLI